MEPKPVEVLHDGAWYPGTLDRWRRCDQRGWIGPCGGARASDYNMWGGSRPNGYVRALRPLDGGVE